MLQHTLPGIVHNVIAPTYERTQLVQFSTQYKVGISLWRSRESEKRTGSGLEINACSFRRCLRIRGRIAGFHIFPTISNIRQVGQRRWSSAQEKNRCREPNGSSKLIRMRVRPSSSIGQIGTSSKKTCVSSMVLQSAEWILFQAACHVRPFQLQANNLERMTIEIYFQS